MSKTISISVYDLESMEKEIDELKKKKEKAELELQDKQKVIQYYKKEKKRLQIEIGGLMGERDGLQMVVERLHKEIAERDEEILRNAKDYVVLFRKYAITSILLLISLIINFILIIN